MNEIPTHMDYCHDMARIAAQMAGYDFDALSMAYDDPAKRKLAQAFNRKGMAAVQLLAPAAVDLEQQSGPDVDRVPDGLRKAGHARGEHAVRIARQWRGMTIEQLAESSGLSAALITAIEAREVDANEIHEFALAAALDVSPHELIDWRVTAPELDRHEYLADLAASLHMPPDGRAA